VATCCLHKFGRVVSRWVGICLYLFLAYGPSKCLGQTSVTIDASQWAELINAVEIYDVGAAGWLYNIFAYRFTASDGSSDQNGAWWTRQMLTNFAFWRENDWPELMQGVGQIDTDFQELLPLVDNIYGEVDEGFEVAHDDAYAAYTMVSNQFAFVREDLSDVVSSVGALAAWGDPDVGEGIRVQLMNDSIDANIDLNGGTDLSYGGTFSSWGTGGNPWTTNNEADWLRPGYGDQGTNGLDNLVSNATNTVTGSGDGLFSKDSLWLFPIIRWEGDHFVSTNIAIELTEYIPQEVATATRYILTACLYIGAMFCCVRFLSGGGS